jgi:hypothetical protein
MSDDRDLIERCAAALREHVAARSLVRRRSWADLPERLRSAYREEARVVLVAAGRLAPGSRA